MKQLSFLDDVPHTAKKIEWHLFVDGAARNNPGPAGAGIYLVKNGEPTIKQGFFLGNKTNNQAEYLALILGISQAKLVMHKRDEICIFSDSQLLVQQIKGIFSVKNPELRILHGCAREILTEMNYTVHHIARSLNSVADSLANYGIDKKIQIPENLIHHCRR